ncbi:MAG: HupE/UreJ family protein [Cyanobacteria bacterium P01_D01_bin.123]
MLGALLPLLLALPARAHGANVIQIELREKDDARYEWQVAPPLNRATVELPQLPDRCSATATPANLEDGKTLSFVIDCAERTLGESDIVRFSEAADGAMVVAYWANGTTNSRFFPADADVVNIAMETLRQQDPFPGLTVRYYTRFGLRHGFLDWNHLAIALAIAASARSWQRLRWISAFALGQGAAVFVWIAFGGAGLALLPAEWAIAGVGAMLALRSLARRNRTEAASATSKTDGVFSLVLGGLGFWHGLGIASTLASSPTAVMALGLATFVIGMDGAQLALVAGFTGAIALSRKLPGVTAGAAIPSYATCGLCIAGLVLTQARGGFSLPNLFAAEANQAIGQATAADNGGLPVSNARPAATRAEAEAVAKSSETRANSRPTTTSSSDTAEVASFLTVEPYEIRHEILVSIDVAINWLNSDAIAGNMTEIDRQTVLKELVGERFSQASTVTINGEAIAPVIDRVNFVVEGEDEVPIVQETLNPEALDRAKLGVVLAYVPKNLPKAVTLTWDNFPTEAIAATVTDPETVTTAQLTSQQPNIAWKDTSASLTLPTLEAIQVTAPQVTVPLLSIGLILLAVSAEIRLRQQSKPSYKSAYLAGMRLLLPFAIVAYPVMAVSATLPVGWRSQLSHSQAASVLNGLLNNVYRAFEFREESDIYDKLALSVTGDELTDIYLDSRRALEVENQGGARARVEQVDVTRVEGIRSTNNGSIVLQAQWQVGGSVSHFGHTHFRHNQYEALIELAIEDDVWKIVDLEVVDEHRLL